MMNLKGLFSAFILLLLIPGTSLFSQSEETAGTDHLVVLWTSDDPYVAERIAFMYAHAAKKAEWFKEVTLIIWGPSAKLTAENLWIQEKLAEMKKDGVVIEACIVCANEYDVTDELKELGFEVKPMGKPLTEFLKSGSKVLTF